MSFSMERLVQALPLRRHHSGAEVLILSSKRDEAVDAAARLATAEVRREGLTGRVYAVEAIPPGLELSRFAAIIAGASSVNELQIAALADFAAWHLDSFAEVPTALFVLEPHAGERPARWLPTPVLLEELAHESGWVPGQAATLTTVHGHLDARGRAALSALCRSCAAQGLDAHGPIAASPLWLPHS